MSDARAALAILIVTATATLGAGAAGVDGEHPAARAATNPEVSWSRTYPGFSDATGTAVTPGIEDGYVLAATYAAGDTPGRNTEIRKVRPDGEPEWSRLVDKSEDRVVTDVTTLADGYLVVGYAGTASGEQAWLLKLDPDGSVAWQKTFGTRGADHATAVTTARNGNAVVVGYSERSVSTRAWSLQIDPDGTRIRKETYDGFTVQRPRAVVQTENGDFLVVGSAAEGDGTEGWILRTGILGDKQWTKTVGGRRPVRFTGVVETNDGFAVTGTVRNDDGTHVGLVASYADDGTRRDAMRINPREDTTLRSIHAVGPGTVVATGTVQPPDDSATGREEDVIGSDGLLVRVSFENQAYFPSTYGGPRYDGIADSLRAADGGYVAVGTSVNDDGIQRLWALRTVGDRTTTTTAPPPTTAGTTTTAATTAADTTTATDTPAMAADGDGGDTTDGGGGGGTPGFGAVASGIAIATLVAAVLVRKRSEG